MAVLIMGIREFLDRNRDRRDREKQAFEDAQIERRVIERQMSANERELLRFKKKEREEHIKRQLEAFRAKEKFDIEHNHNPIHAPNIFDHSESMLKAPNIFADQPNMFMQNRGMFFKG